MSTTCVIIDDEKLARDLLKEYLENYPELEILDEADQVT
jgi:DNA-binding NarL/FixJ family response regulator